MKRKLTSIVFILVLCVLVACVVVGCKKHAHDFGEWTVTKEATCIDSGLRTRSCSGCDISEQETIPALNHDYSWSEGVLPTCTEGGSVGHYECLRCHKYFDVDKNLVENITLKASHSVGSLIAEVKATCEKEGVKAHYHCSVCNRDLDESMNVLSSTVLEKIDHDYGNWIAEVPAACGEVGIKGHYECSECHNYFDENKAVIEDLYITALSHVYGEWIAEVLPTCEKEGTKGHYECSLCHKYFDAQTNEMNSIVIAPKDHAYGEWIEEVSSTCSSVGTKGHYECSGCNRYFDIDKVEITDLTIAESDHDYGEWIDEVKATCEKEGMKGHYECSVCHKVFDADRNEIDDLSIPKAHSLYLIEGKAATCTEDGIIDTYRCSVCRRVFDADGENVSDTVIPAKGHTYTDIIAEKAATATENGVKEHKDCTTCGLHFDADGKVIDDLVIPALSHVYGEWIDEVEATCTENGTKGHYECSHCSLVFDAEYNVIEDLTIVAAHDLDFIERVEPTCTEDGNLAVYVCKKCIRVFDENNNPVENPILSALGHNYGVWVEEKAATCEENGEKAHKTCLRCEKDFDADGNRINIVIKASHNLTRVAEISATCTESGTQAYDSCSVCQKNFDVFGKEITDLASLVIDAKGHAYGEWIDGFAASCDESGVKGRFHCKNCDKDYDENDDVITNLLIAPLGHTNTTQEIIPQVDATCTQDGYVAHFECEVCGKYTDENNVTIENIVLQKTGHTIGSRRDAQFPTCTESGYDSCFVCGVCSEYFSSINVYVSLTDEDLYRAPDGHRFNHYERIEPTCESTGRKEYYYCNSCSKYFDENKELVEDRNFSIPNTGHDCGDLIIGTPATETEDGTINHYQCKNCLQYFNEQGNQVDTIVIPKTQHVFEAWNSEIPASCTKDGVKGYYKCSECGLNFDKDYQVIEDLTIHAHHSVGKLTPASQGKCSERDVLISYYECSVCYAYLDEEMNVLEYDDVFVYAYHHDYIIVSYNDWQHVYECRDCKRRDSESHSYKDTYFIENGVYLRKESCEICDYEGKPETYSVVSDIEILSDFYVGYHDASSCIFRINYRSGSESTVWASYVMDEKENERFEALIQSLSKDFEPFTETFTVTYYNYTGEVDILFRPFVIKGIKTTQAFYQQGSLTSINELSFVYDCNYTDITGDILDVYGSIVDDGAFDPDFDFAANGVDTKIFVVKFDLNGVVYDVEVAFVNSVRPAFIYYYRYDNWIVKNGKFEVTLRYTDGSERNVEVTQDMVVSGSFDPSVLGEQTFEIRIEGITTIVALTVRDPSEVSHFYVYETSVNIGENLRIFVNYLGGYSKILDVTPDMIEGVFDNTVAGDYEITVVYKGESYRCTVTVKDPKDERIDSISIYNDSTIVWDVQNGVVVVDVEYMYIQAYKKNGSYEYVKITEDMISYSQDAVDAALADPNAQIEVLVIYYGKTTQFYVYVASLQDQNWNGISLYRKSNLDYGTTSTIYMQDGDLSDYFVKVTSGSGAHYLPLTRDLFFTLNYDDGTVTPFDFENAKNNEVSRVAIILGEAIYNNVSLLVYTESDIEYHFSSEIYDDIVAGTKEEVLAQLKGSRFSLHMNVCHYNSYIESFYFEDLIIGPNEKVDFSREGYVYIEASYKGIVGYFGIRLIPNVEGVEKTVYRYTEEEVVEIYENGYAYYSERGAWFEWVKVSEELNIYELKQDDESLFFMLVDGVATEVMAESLEDNSEVYTFVRPMGNSTIKVYTKLGLSLGDIYDEDGDYTETVRVEFSTDGKYLEFSGIKYFINADNSLEIEPEGNTLYLFYMQEDETSYVRGIFNDNGKAYFYMGQTDADGALIMEILTFSYDWTEEDGVVTLYYNGRPIQNGTIEDGYFVFDEDDYL